MSKSVSVGRDSLEEDVFQGGANRQPPATQTARNECQFKHIYAWRAPTFLAMRQELRALAAKDPTLHELESKTAHAIAAVLVWGSITHAMDHAASIA